MASCSLRSLLSLMPGRTSDRVLSHASSNCAKGGSERKLHLVRSPFWVLGECIWQAMVSMTHALGPKCLKRNDSRDPNMTTFLKFGTLPIAEFWCHGCCKASAAKTAKREHGMEWPVPFQKAELRGYWWWTKLSNTCACALCLPPPPFPPKAMLKFSWGPGRNVPLGT